MGFALEQTFAPQDAARGADSSTLAVRRLSLGDFRSYAALRLEIDHRPVVLTGPNGAGKTNLLEAISFLAPGRGLRGARLSDVDREGGGPWAVAAQLEDRSGSLEIGTGRMAEAERERRAIRINGAVAASQAALAELVSAIWLTPDMDRLLQDGAAARRRFLDRLVLAEDPAHAGQVASHGHALRERARLLREGRFDPAWLGALERRAAAAGVAVAAARRLAIAGLCAALEREPGSFPRPELAVVGEVEAWLDDQPALEVEGRYAEALAAGRREDAESGTTGVGPHRSDLLVRHRASGRLARNCSTGQQKALLVSIVLAAARLRAAQGERLPILLLDEIAAHLDPERRADLFDELAGLGAQVWLTGTDAALFAPFGACAQHFHVAESKLHAYDPSHPCPA